MKKMGFIFFLAVMILANFSSCKKVININNTILTELNGSWTVAENNIQADGIIATSTGLVAYRDTAGKPAWYSVNHGTTWTAAGPQSMSNVYWVMADVTNNARLMAYSSADNNIYLSTNGGQSWGSVNHPTDTISLHAQWLSGGNLFAWIAADTTTLDSIHLMYSPGYFILESSNYGNSWDTVFRFSYNTDSLFAAQNLIALRSVGSLIYAFTYTQIYSLQNNGSTWSAINSVIPAGGQYAGVLGNGNVIGYGDETFYRSTDSCRTWNPVLTLQQGQNGSLAFDSCVVVVSNYDGASFICGNPRTGKWMAADGGLPNLINTVNLGISFDSQYVYLIANPVIYRRLRTDFATM